MRKWVILICAVFLTGCSHSVQVEDLAIAVVLGADFSTGGEIEVIAEVPKVKGSRGESSGSSDSDLLMYSASGNTFDEALTALQWAVPRRLDLSQLEVIVLSESLAQSMECEKVFDTIMATPRIYTAARLVICSGSTYDFMKTLKPVIGGRLSTELTASLEDAIRGGSCPDVSFADVYYQGKSVYSDSLAIYSDIGGDLPAAAMIPERQQTMQNEDAHRFLGSAVLREEKMVGKLSGRETLFCRLLRGEVLPFPYSADGKTVGLTMVGFPSIHMDLKKIPAEIIVKVRFAILPSSRRGNIRALEAELSRDLTAVIQKCQSLSAEPFLFSEKAAANFLTLDEWIRFNWHRVFRDSKVQVEVTVSENDG